MNHIKQIIAPLLASFTIVVLAGCGGKEKKAVQESSEQNVQASKGQTVANAQKSGGEVAKKPADQSSAAVAPTEVDQGVVTPAVQLSPVSAEKKALSEKIGQIDNELRQVEEALQGALFEVRQKDPVCTELTALLRAKNEQIAQVLEKHPTRVEAQKKVEATSIQLNAAREHFDETLRNPGPVRGKRDPEANIICQICSDNGAYNGNERFSHKQAAAKWLSDAQNANNAASRDSRMALENIQKTDDDFARLIADRDQVQLSINQRFESNPLTADILSKRQSLLNEKKDANSSWLKIITTKSIPSPQAGNTYRTVNTDS